ncbi:MAG TPA: TonB-dependent receptor [Hyphomonadaceae bacterium]|nr:TonB-dependent receptor [Hyphomonadaceae bacterium]
MKRTKYHLFASMLALGAAMPAFAQTPAPAPQAPQGADQDRRASDVIVVTANKRQESVQDVAVAVTAITSEAKEELGIISVTDLTNVTPGMSYTPGNERVTLRGVGRLTNNFGADLGVANYNDGIYTAFAVFAGKDPMLIDRVEVLRGPQGTLYGRNSIGGAINTVSKRPSDEFESVFLAGVSEYEGRKLGVSVSGPINDWLRYRVAGFAEEREGIDRDYGAGEKTGWEIDDNYLEAQLEGDIGDRFSWWFKVADLNYDKAGPPGGRTATFSNAPYLTNVGGFSTGTLIPNAAYAFGTDAALISYTQTGGRKDNPFATNKEHAYNNNFESVASLPQYDEYDLEAVYSFDDFDVKYVGGYVFYDYRLRGDFDGTPVTALTYQAITSQITAGPCAAFGAIPLINYPTTQLSSLGGAGCITSSAPKTIYPNQYSEYFESRAFFSNEVNFISTNDNPLQWIVGLYQYQENSNQTPFSTYQRDAASMDFRQELTTGLLNPNPNRRGAYWNNKSIQFAYGLYGQADYQFTDQIKLTGGLRYSYDLKKFNESAQYVCYIICSATTGLTYDAVDVTAASLAGVFRDPALGGAPGWQPGILNASAANSWTGISRTPDGVAHRRLQNDWSAITGLLGIEYTPTDSTLLFAKYSRGYKAGGFNAQSMSVQPQTDQEGVNAYEAGWKQELNELNLTANTAVFYYDYQDSQAPQTIVTNPGVPGSATYVKFVNLPKVEMMGVELEGSWRPLDNLNIGFTYAYLDTDIKDGGGTYVDPSRAAADPLARISVNGHEMPQSPKNKVALNGSYTFDFEDGSGITATTSYYWRDKFYDGIFNNANEQAPTQTQVDARLIWDSPDKTFKIIGWVRNLLDDEQNTSISANGYRVQDNGRYSTYSYAPPRMFGIDFKMTLN